MHPNLSDPISRRSFLHVSTGALATQWIVAKSFAETRATPTSAIAATVPQCPVGLVDRSHENMTSLGADSVAPQRRIIPAERLRSGDPRLASQGIRLQCAGIRLPEGRVSRQLRSLTLDLAMEVPGTASGTVPWKLWSYSNQRIKYVSGNVDVYVPLRGDGSLVFDMTVQWGAEPARNYQAKLTTGHSHDVSKLCPGTYCIAVPDGECQFPSAWRSARWEDSANAARGGLYLPASAEANPKAGVPVPFAHLVFIIEEASTEAPAFA